MAHLPPKRKDSEDGFGLESAINPARNYPRKRVAVAVDAPRCICWLLLLNLVMLVRGMPPEEDEV